MNYVVVGNHNMYEQLLLHYYSFYIMILCSRSLLSSEIDRARSTSSTYAPVAVENVEDHYGRLGRRCRCRHSRGEKLRHQRRA